MDGLANGLDGDVAAAAAAATRATPGRCCQQASSAAPAALPDTGTSVRSRSRGSGRSLAGAPVSVDPLIRTALLTASSRLPHAATARLPPFSGGLHRGEGPARGAADGPPA